MEATLPKIGDMPSTWPTAAVEVLHLLLAYVMALPIGWNREREERSAGLRTFPIVSVAACGLTMLAVSMPGATPDSFSRVLQGLVTGVGFIGGGVILHVRGAATGLATAASVWSTAIVGAAVAVEAYHIALALTLLNWLTFTVLTPLKARVDSAGGNGRRQQDAAGASSEDQADRAHDVP